jgi:hypothetical protein
LIAAGAAMPLDDDEYRRAFAALNAAALATLGPVPSAWASPRRR